MLNKGKPEAAVGIEYIEEEEEERMSDLEMRAKRALESQE